MNARLPGIAFVMVMVSTPARAAAEEPFGVEAAARAGFGYGGGGSLRFGGGARAGATVSSIYFGVTAMSFFSGSYAVSSPPGAPFGATPSSGTESIQVLLYGVALGYDLRPTGWLTVRPAIAAGVFSLSGSCTPGCSVESVSSAYVGPTVTAAFGLGKHLFVGPEADALLVPGSGFILALDVQAGLRF